MMNYLFWKKNLKKKTVEHRRFLHYSSYEMLNSIVKEKTKISFVPQALSNRISSPKRVSFPV